MENYQNGVKNSTLFKIILVSLLFFTFLLAQQNNGKNPGISDSIQNRARYIFSDNGQDFHVKAKLLIPDKGPTPLNVFCMAQDKKGFLWFGSTHGLLKYDGYTMTIFKHNPDDPNSLSNNIVGAILVSRNGDLWIGTRNGLNRFDPECNKFIVYYFQNGNTKNPYDNSIRALYEDKNGFLLIGAEGGFGQFNPKTGEFTILNDNSSIHTIAENKQGDVWFGGGAGLFKYNQETKKFSHFLPDPQGSDNFIFSILVDKKNVLWLGTGSGFLHLSEDPSGSYTFIRDRRRDNNLYINPDNRVWSIYEDKMGILWISCQSGLYRYDRNMDKEPKTVAIQVDRPEKIPRVPQVVFEDNAANLWISASGETFKVEKRNPYVTRITDTSVAVAMKFEIKAVVESKNNVLWIGTTKYGLIKFDRKKHKWTHFVAETGNSNSLSDNHITSMALDTSGYIWIGTDSGGLNRFDPQKKEWKHYQQDNIPGSLIHSWVSAVYIGRDNTLWVGTGRGILNRYDRQKDTFTQFRHRLDDTNSIGKSNRIISILEDSFGILWIGIEKDGLNRYDPGRNKFTHYLNEPGNSKSLSHNMVTHLFEDSNKMLWIGTRGGLNLLDLKAVNEIDKNPVFKRYFTGKLIRGILEDDAGNIWISAGVLDYNFIRYNPETEDFTDFSYLFKPRSELLYKSNYTGEFFVRSTKGFFSFNPLKIKVNQVKPEVVLTDFQIFNESVPIAGDTNENKEKDSYQLDKSITETANITLSYKEKIFAFEFAALHFTDPALNQYAYKMEGLDERWNYIGTRHYVSFNNLPAGEYLFRVKASNNEGVWNEEGTSIKIIITPPWWETTWAYFLYVFFIGAVIYSVWRFQSNKLKMKHRLEIEHLHAEKLEEVDRMKSRFFANISHEFRTPLTLILGPVQSMFKKIGDIGLKNELNIVLRNANRLERLVNQLLDLSRLEAGKIELKVQEMDIVPLLRKLVLAFTSHAERKGITLKYKCKTKSLLAFIDLDKIEKIMNNLLSNAFKFTPKGGVVEVAVSSGRSSDRLQSAAATADSVEISITNTGPGIQPDQLDKIFNRFYSAPLNVGGDAIQNPERYTYPTGEQGSGIGLALVKELVELHYGKIHVQCKRKGTQSLTTFTILVPLSREQYSEDEIIVAPLVGNKDEIELISKGIEVSDQGYEEQEDTEILASPKTLPLVLLIEDNTDMRTYVWDHLQSYYRVVLAADGEKGWYMAKQRNPDLIISDIMMPKMDGFQVCEKIKSDISTSHIPIILLTARAELKDKLTGLELGADDYIPKPFAIEELQVRIKNLIEQRQKLRERFINEALFGINDIGHNPRDKRFLQQVVNILNEHIDDPGFTVQKMCDSIGMSRMSLHLKIKALTSQSPHNLIRIIRLKKAAVLLRQKTISVSQIAYDVGFKNLSHFAKTFQKQFGESPSHFSARY